MRLLTTILGFFGMRRDVPPTTLDVEAATANLPLYEAVNVDPSAFPEIVPRPAWQYLNENDEGNVFPHGLGI